MPTLKNKREEKFITQRELSELSGVSVSNINRIERGKQKPTFKTIKALSKALGIKPGDIDW